MNVWEILGIEPTKDKNLLKKAYRTKLTGVNPEDDPEGFMKLREAYEESLRLADFEDEEEVKEAEEELVGIALKIDELYHDFANRIEPEKWEELFDCDEFVALDTSEESFEAMMHYFMSHFHLPQRVWKLIVDTFDIVKRKKELAEKFPEDFLDYVINNANYDDPIDYRLLSPKESSVGVEDYDRYIELFYQLNISMDKKSGEAQEELFEALEALPIKHPYLEVCRVKSALQQMNTQWAKENETEGETAEGESAEEQEFSVRFAGEIRELLGKLETLREDYPDDIVICNCCGDIAILLKDYEKAKEFFDRSKEIAPDNYTVRAKQADLAYYQGEYEKSRDMFMDLLKEKYYDNNVRGGMLRANQGLIEQLAEKIKENPEDNDSRLEIAWSYYQSYRFSEAIQVLDEFEPSAEKICEYNNVKGRTYLCLMEYEKALQCFLIWKSAIEAIPEESTDKDSLDKKKRYEYVNCLLADCYLKTKEYEEARKYLNVALAKEHEEILLAFEARCELEYETKNYEACIDACDLLLERDDRNYAAFNYRAKACFALEYIKEGMSACEKAIFIYPFAAEPYIQEIEILLKYNHTEGARNVIRRYQEFNIPSDRMDYYEAEVNEREDQIDDALDILNRISERYNPEESDLEDLAKVKLLMGDCYDQKDQDEMALKCYEEVREINPEHRFIFGRLGILYKRLGKFREALEYLTRQIDIVPSANYYIHRGIIYRYFEDFDRALEDFGMALKYEPDNAYCYSRIGLIYEQMGEPEKALEQYDLALKYAGNERFDSSVREGICIFRARVLQCLLRFEESKAQYEQFFEEYGLNADVAFDYSELLQRMNQIDVAVKLLGKCIESLEYSDDVQMCIRQLCAIYGDEGYIDRANECFKLAISKNPKDIRAYAIMAYRFFKHGLYHDAKRLYEDAVHLDKDNKENYYSELVEVLCKMKKISKSDMKKYIQKAYEGEVDQSNPRDYIKLARVERVTKKYKKALEIIDKGLSVRRCFYCFYAKCHEALYEKGLIYEALKDYEMARMCYQQALQISGHNALYEKKIKEIEGK